MGPSGVNIDGATGATAPGPRCLQGPMKVGKKSICPSGLGKGKKYTPSPSLSGYLVSELHLPHAHRFTIFFYIKSTKNSENRTNLALSDVFQWAPTQRMSECMEMAIRTLIGSSRVRAGRMPIAVLSSGCAFLCPSVCVRACVQCAQACVCVHVFRAGVGRGTKKIFAPGPITMMLRYWWDLFKFYWHTLFHEEQTDLMY